MDDACQLQKREQFAVDLRKKKKRQQLANLRKRFSTPTKQTAFDLAGAKPVWSQILEAFESLKSERLVSQLKMCMERVQNCKPADETWNAIE